MTLLLLTSHLSGMTFSSNSKKLMKTLRPLNLISQFLGITFPVATYTKKFKLIIAYRIIIFAILLLALIREIPTIMFWSRNLRGIHGMLAFIETRLRWLALLFNFLFTCYNNTNINDAVASLINSPLILKEKEYKKIFRSQIVIIVVTFCLIVCYMCLGHDIIWLNPYYTWFSSTIYIVTEIYLGISNVQFVILLLVITKYFSALNENLKKSDFKPGFSEKEENYIFFLTKASNQDSVSEIVKFRQIHMNLTSACKKTNQCFSLQILLFLVVSLVEITYSLRSIVVFSLDTSAPDPSQWRINPFLEMSLIFFWGGYYIWSILKLVVACENTVFESRKTAAVVHELINVVEDKDVEKQLFSLQMMNHKVAFSAGKFVLMNYSLLNSIVGTITTYLIIIITFS